MTNIVIWIKQNISFILGFIIIFISITYFANSERGIQLTDQFLDPLRITDSRDEVIIVGIDDKSLKELGAWPWDRKVFADLTKKLDEAGAKSVVYDILFLETRSGDELFKDVLLNTEISIVLGSKLENNQYTDSHLLDSSNILVKSAIANVEPDSDGKVRKFPIAFNYKDSCISPLGEAAFNLFTFKKNTECNKDTGKMFRYPTSISTYSLVDILNGEVSSEKLKGKVAFIGSTSLDLMDHFVGLSGEKIPGVYVHASIFTSLLNKENDRNCTWLEIACLILMYLVITSFVIFRTKTILGQVGVTLFAGISIFIITVAFASYGIILPTPWLLVTVFIVGGYITLFRFIKERKKSEYVQSLFSKYVHKDVLKELMKSSSSLNFAGEKRDMTILFSDIRGFTTLSESLEPEELTRILNAYLSAMTPSILEEKGTIDKFIGDAIMAFWNAPLFVKDHTTHAVKAALGMEKALEEFNKTHDTKLAVGIGIHRGNVIVGNVGSQERVNYTVLGDAVNLASRIEGLTKKYGVGCLVSGEARDEVKTPHIIFRKLDVITVKGKNKPTTLYEAREKDNFLMVLFEQYEKGFEMYERGEFDQAEKIFQELADNGDKPSKAMLERIEIVRNEKDWDGVWHWDEK